MKKSRYTETQIVKILKEIESGSGESLVVDGFYERQPVVRSPFPDLQSGG